MRPRFARRFRGLLAAAGVPALVLATACHDPDAPPEAAPPPGVSEFVLEHMGRGGAVRPVIYTPPPDLAMPEPRDMELPFPGPEVDDEEVPDPAPEEANEQEEETSPGPAAGPSPDDG